MELWLDHHISYCTIWKAIHRLGYTHKQVKNFSLCNQSFIQFIVNLFILFILVV